MFATFTIRADGRETTIHINPDHVTAVIEMDNGTTRIYLSGGSDHTVSEHADSVLRQLQEAFGPIPI